MFVFASIKLAAACLPSLTPRCLCRDVSSQILVHLSLFLSAFRSVLCPSESPSMFSSWSVLWRRVYTVCHLLTLRCFCTQFLFTLVLSCMSACFTLIRLPFSLKKPDSLAALLFIRLSVSMCPILYVTISTFCCLDVCPSVSVLSA